MIMWPCSQSWVLEKLTSTPTDWDVGPKEKLLHISETIETVSKTAVTNYHTFNDFHKTSLFIILHYSSGDQKFKMGPQGCILPEGLRG